MIKQAEGIFLFGAEARQHALDVVPVRTSARVK